MKDADVLGIRIFVLRLLSDVSCTNVNAASVRR